MTAAAVAAPPEAQPHGSGKRKLRVLMVAARYFPLSGGIETHVHEVGVRLARTGHAVTVLTADPSGSLPRHDWVGGMEVVRVPSGPKGKDWCLAPGLYRHLTGSGPRPDIVHVQGYHTFSAPLGMLGAMRARLPFVLTFHSGGHSSPLRRAIRSPQTAVLAPLARRAARLIGVSKFEADHFSRAMGIPRDRFVVVPNGAGLPAAEVVSPPEDGPLIISLGRLERYKGHHRALEGFARLRRTLPKARLRILGSGPYERELRNGVSQLGLGGCVEIGGIPAAHRGEMASALASAALVVLLSDYEAHPIAVVEALSLGRRVVTTDTSGFRELADLGLVHAIPVGASGDEIAAAMMQEIARAEAPSKPVALPDWDACAETLEGVYRSVVAADAR